ncbi:MAG TPA: MinD/ParA family protein [Symbiobacteriaceae bacterium]|nr:MinD/ParA family protein [Symbiobacteriaceae bacterium]
MPKIVSVHSFRGGTGKSNTSANLAALCAARGLRVGVVDTDIQSPGIHVLFGLQEGSVHHSLNDFLWGKCQIQETAHDVTAAAGSVPGRIFLIPSSIKAGEITRILREGYDVALLSDGFQRLVEELHLDVLIIDTHPGLNEETLLSIAVSDVLLLILRPDNQDYQGTGVTVEVSRKLRVPNLLLLVNKAPASFDLGALQSKVQQTYNTEVAAVIPHSDEMMALASAGLFVIKYPDHPVTALFRQVAERVLG